MTKHIIILVALIWLTTNANCQVAINKDGSLPHPSSMLDIKATDAGLLVPRMSTLQQNAITNPETGLLIFNTTENNFNYFNGAGWENVSAKNGVFNVLDFGALNDGTNAGATTNAINSAISQLLLQAEPKGVLYFPPGKYLVNAMIEVLLSNPFQGISIIGDGPGISVIVFEASATGGFDISFPAGGGYDNGKGSVEIKGLSLETRGTSSGAAIHFTSLGTSSPAPSKNIENVSLSGNSPSSYWPIGIKLSDCTFANITDVKFQGKADGTSRESTAVLLEGDNNPVDTFINKLRVWNADIGVEVTGTNEGVTVSQSVFLSVNKGIFWHTDTGSHEPWFAINNCHISASEECILAHQLMQSQINNNLFYCLAKNGINWTGIYFSSDIQVPYGFHEVSHNTFHGFDNGALRNGIIMNNIANSMLTGNIFYNTITGIFLSNVSNTNVFDNMNIGNSTDVYQTGCTGINVR
jgi:hypothetical protein